MGQVQSQADFDGGGVVAARYQGRGGDMNAGTKATTSPARSGDQEDQRQVRKLSTISSRNIQLLSMKPRSDRDAYAEGLRARRRSSLINLILGAPSSGPRFSDDLCSLSSHMSDLCGNFGIDYFPDLAPAHHHGTKTNSLASSFTRLDESSGGPKLAARTFLSNGQQYGNVNGIPHEAVGSADVEHDAPLDRCHSHQHRRRSSLGSLSSFEPPTATGACLAGTGVPEVTSRPSCGTTKANPFNCVSYDLAGEGVSTFERSTKCGGKIIAGSDQSSHQAVGHVLSMCDSPQNSQRDRDSRAVSTSLSGQHQFYRRRPSLSSIFLASIDLTSSFDGTDASKHLNEVSSQRQHQAIATPVCIGELAQPLAWSRKTMNSAGSNDSGCSHDDSARAVTSRAKDTYVVAKTVGDNGTGAATGTATFVPSISSRINQTGPRRVIHRSGSELSLYSSVSASSAGNLSHHQLFHHHHSHKHGHQHLSAYHSSPLCSQTHRHMSRVDSIGTNSFKQCSRYCSGGSLGRPAKKLLPYGLMGEPTVGDGSDQPRATASVRETKLIIMLQVCLPFILAGFGNMAAGLVLNKIAHWDAFRSVPIFFVLLPSFVGLKGNIEMTLASRLSTLANLRLLETSYQRRHAYVSNLILILSQAIGLSIFAASASMLCEYSTGKLELELVEIMRLSALVVLPCALITSIVLVIVSSIMMWAAICFANIIQVNPDNLSTLVAAMYGDVSCVLTYGLFAQLMLSCHQQGTYVLPILIISLAVISWPVLWYSAFKFKETHDLALSSMPPMLTGIVVSLGSGTVLSLVVGRFSRIALYQPVVNGFGANLIAVQASRVSTWLWCGALRRLSSAPVKDSESTNKSKTHFKPSKLGASLVSFVNDEADSSPHKHDFNGAGKMGAHGVAILKSVATGIPRLAVKIFKTLLWSFFNPSPNSVAARLLLIMLVPAHTLYFFVIWLLSPASYVVITWQFYMVYIALCLSQVFILLTICEPLMTFLMKRHLDPDIFGISLLMALADLVGTLCLTGAFMFLASVGDPNAH